ncbi:MAG: glycosyltransferase family 4 protein, partial [Mycobacterium sp.]|nr:glycosyltransferase family 4 protein [Mycobacterium sp.]
ALERRAADTGIADRIRFTGPLTGEALQQEYHGADVFVLPSRSETYGMVIAEALAAGLPVIATGAGGITEALGRTASGTPGLLLPPGDRDVVAAALACWLTDAELRCRLRRAALHRRDTLQDWRKTVDRVGTVLAAVRDEPDSPPVREKP